MDNKDIKSILEDALEQEIPSSQVNLLPIVKASLVAGRKLSTRQGEKMNIQTSRRMQRIALTALMIAAFMTVALITPQGRAFAQSVLQFFRRAESNILPLPTEQIAPPEEAQAMSTAQPPAPIVSAAEAEQAAGFDAKELPSVPEGFEFAGAMANQGSISIQYEAVGGGGALVINESANGFMQSEWDQAPVESISQVKIGEVDAEIVQGTFVVYPGETVARWNSNAPVLRLRWIENGIWFEMAKFGGVEVIEYLNQAGLIALAESMVYTSGENQSLPSVPASPTEVQGVTAESNHVISVSIAEAENVAQFDVKELPSTPQGMIFVGATATQGSINIEYEAQETGAGILTVSQSLQTENWKQVPAEAITKVRVGEVEAELIRGDYVFLPGDTQGTWNADISVVSLRWVENGVYFVISMYGGGVGSLAHLDQQGLITLAESLVNDPFTPLAVKDAEAHAGFDVLEPSILPGGMTFLGASFDPASKMVSLSFGYSDTDRRILINQQPVNFTDACDLCGLVGASASVESVQIGDVTGEYALGVWELTNNGPVWRDDPYLKTIRWQENGMAFELIFMGTEVEKEELLSMAESIK